MADQDTQLRRHQTVEKQDECWSVMCLDGLEDVHWLCRTKEHTRRRLEEPAPPEGIHVVSRTITCVLVKVRSAEAGSVAPGRQVSISQPSDEQTSALSSVCCTQRLRAEAQLVSSC